MIFNLLFILLIAIIAQQFGLLPFVLGKKPIPQNPFLPIIIGTGIIGLISQFLLLGGRIDGFSFLVVSAGAFTIRWRYKTLVRTDINHRHRSFYTLPKMSLLTFIFCLFIIAFQAAQVTKINDMGMYYLQTLKWMNTFGLVKGIANLHPAYGLYSSWHSLIALFSFKEIVQMVRPESNLCFTGINAYLVMMALGFFIWEFNYQFKLFTLVFSLAFLPLAFLFLTAPSPDLALIFYTSFILFLALSGKDFNLEILLLASFTFWIKPPAIFAVILGLIAYKNLWQAYLHQFKTFEKSKKIIKVITLVLLPALLVSPGIFKNYILSGHYLYPMSNQGLPILASVGNTPAWQVPADWNKAYRTGIINWGNSDDFSKEIIQSQNNKNGYFKQLTNWLSRSGYKGWMNKLIALAWIAALIQFFTGLQNKTKYKFHHNSNHLFFLGLNLIILLLEWMVLRQYRLLLPSTLSLICLIFMPYKTPEWQFSKNALGISILILYGVLCFFPFALFKDNSRNKMVTSFGNQSFKYSLIPFHDYGDTSIFKVYCWNQPLPCQSESHRKFLQNYGYQIVQLGDKTSEGFKLIPVSK